MDGKVEFINILRNKKSASLKEFKSLIIKISGSLKAYEGYLRAKDNEKEKENLPIRESEKIYDYIIKKIREIERWLIEKKD